MPTLEVKTANTRVIASSTRQEVALANETRKEIRDESMTAPVIFANPAARLAAAQIAENAYLVFEYQGNDHIKVGENIENLRERLGHMICRRVELNRRLTLNVLSPSMSYARAKLVVAPWQDDQAWQAAANTWEFSEEWELSSAGA